MGEKPSIERKIARTAARQYGNVTRKQLLNIGLGGDAIDYRLQLGRLYRVHHGVYAVGYPPVTPLQRAMAAVLACGPEAVLSHGSAMTLWGVWKRWEEPFEVSSARDRRPRSIRLHRRRSLARPDATVQLGIPVTTPARTLLDIAPRLTAASLRRAVKDAQTARTLSLDALAELLGRLPHHPGAPALRRFVSDPDDTRSRLEDRFLAFCQRARLPRPQVNVSVCGFLVDALFPAERVIVELDSWSFHSNRESFEDDRERDGVTTAAGFLTVRITWRGFADQTRRLLGILAQRR